MQINEEKLLEILLALNKKIDGVIESIEEHEHDNNGFFYLKNTVIGDVDYSLHLKIHDIFSNFQTSKELLDEKKAKETLDKIQIRGN